MLARITVRGVFSSCEALETNCRCCCQAFSTGRRAQRASSTLSAKNTSSAPAITAPVSDSTERIRLLSSDSAVKAILVPSFPVRFM